MNHLDKKELLELEYSEKRIQDLFRITPITYEYLRILKAPTYVLKWSKSLPKEVNKYIDIFENNIDIPEEIHFWLIDNYEPERYLFNNVIELINKKDKKEIDLFAHAESLGFCKSNSYEIVKNSKTK